MNHTATIEPQVALAITAAKSSELTFDGVLLWAFVMATTIARRLYNLDGKLEATEFRTAPVVGFGQVGSCAFIETEDGKRYLIAAHDSEAAVASFEHVKKFVDLNQDHMRQRRAKAFASHDGPTAVGGA